MRGNSIKNLINSINIEYMKFKPKKLLKNFKLHLKTPSSESVLYVVIVATLILILICFFKSDIVIPTRVKTLYRDYVPKYFSNFVFFFYSILVVPSAFRPIWFIFWPLIFYVIGKKFFKKKGIKYLLVILGFSIAYMFYAIPNHYVVAITYTFKPTEFSINKEFPELCSEKNLMVFAPPNTYLSNPEYVEEEYLSFKEDWSKYVDTPIHYICVGNGTFVNISFAEWNPDKLYCPPGVTLGVSTQKYNDILKQPPSLFPLFVFNCEYSISVYQPIENKKEWRDIFCFNSWFATPKCFLHLLNPSRGNFLPPQHLIVSTEK